jgi:hypothetical protein
VEHFNNLCALGNSIQVRNDTIHIAGTTCVDIGNNQFAPAAYIASYDISGQLISYNQVGDTFRIYEGEKLLMDSLGNKYILGDFKKDSTGSMTNQGVFVQKRNQHNQILWTTEYQDSVSSSFYFARDGALLSNGNILLCGAHNLGTNIQSGVPDQDILLLIFDTSGTIVTQKRIGDNLSQEEARSCVLYDDQRFVLGSVKNYPGSDGNNWVLMLDHQGNILDEYISTSNRRVGVWDIVKTRDGGLACASAATDGDFPTPENKNYVEKLDSNLNQVWDYTMDDFFYDWNLSTSIIEAGNGDIIVGGNYASPTSLPGFVGFDVFLQRLSASGDSIWHRGYFYYNKVTYNETHNMYDLASENDQIYFVGDANDWDTTPPPGQSLWLVSTDSNGVINSIFEESPQLSFRLYPNPARDYFTIELPSIPQKPHLLEIYDINGRLIEQRRLSQSVNTIQTSNWSKGLFIYRLSNTEAEFRGKIIVD